MEKGTWAGSRRVGVMLRLLREPGECPGQSKHPLPTTWTSPDEIKLIKFFAAEDGETL